VGFCFFTCAIKVSAVCRDVISPARIIAASLLADRKLRDSFMNAPLTQDRVQIELKVALLAATRIDK
jgi:hypothetical protein